jgi:hypothetical protein
MHAGMWIEEEFSGVFCARDRLLVGGVFLGVALFILCAAAFGVAVWLAGPSRLWR